MIRGFQDPRYPGYGLEGGTQALAGLMPLCHRLLILWVQKCLEEDFQKHRTWDGSLLSWSEDSTDDGAVSSTIKQAPHTAAGGWRIPRGRSQKKK